MIFRFSAIFFNAGSISCGFNSVWVQFRVGSIPWVQSRWVQFRLGSIPKEPFYMYKYRPKNLVLQVLIMSTILGLRTTLRL